MRIIVGGSLAFVGILIVGLAIHDTLSDAWGVLSQA